LCRTLDYGPTQTSSGLQFTVLGPSGTPLFGNLTEVQPAGGPGGFWALVRGGPASVGVVEGLYTTNGVSDGSAWYQPLDCAP